MKTGTIPTFACGLVLVGMMVFLTGCITVPSTPHTLNRAEARQALIRGDLFDALLSYQHITSSGADPALAAEYAYVLAVAGYWDAAYQQLDRARQMNGLEDDEVRFFTNRVLLVTDNKDLAQAIGPKKQVTPSWIKRKIDKVEGYAKAEIGSPGSYGTKDLDRFARANVLAKQNFLIASAVAFDRFLRTKPNDPSAHLGFSIVLEKLGAYGFASKEAARARDLLKGKPGSDVLERRVESLDKLEQDSGKKGPLSSEGRWFIYGGGQLSSAPGGTEESLSASVGRFLTSEIDMGLAFTHTSTPANAGAAASSLSNLGLTARYTPRLVSEDKDNINWIFGGELDVLNGTDLIGTLGTALQTIDGETDLTLNEDTNGLFSITLGYTLYIRGF